MPDDLHDDWENLFEQLPLDTAPSKEQQETLRQRVIETFESRPTPRSRFTALQSLGRTLMKYKAPHWTIAAILVGCMFWLFESSSKPAFALDELVENIMKAHTAQYDMEVTVEGQPTQAMKALYLEPSHFRQELLNGFVNISDLQTGKVMGLDTVNKRATVFNMVKIPDSAKGSTHLNQFESMRDALRQAMSDPDTNVTPLGESEVDGRKVLGFRFAIPLQPMTVWADPETKFPVRIESSFAGPPKTDVVMKNYEFNVELDESLFRLEIPEGYQIMELDVDASALTEEDFVIALRRCCESSDGEFPSGVDLVSASKYSAAYVVKMGIDKDTGPTAEQLKEVLLISRGFRFAIMLGESSDAHYAGKGVKQGDASVAVFWYKPNETEDYRVLFADFSFKEQSTAPAAPNAVKLQP